MIHGNRRWPRWSLKSREYRGGIEFVLDLYTLHAKLLTWYPNSEWTYHTVLRD